MVLLGYSIEEVAYKMYTLYADDQLIYSPDYLEENLMIENPYYEKESNKAGSCQFVIFNTNPYYDQIKPLKTSITVKENGKDVWYGRVLNTSNDFNNRKTVYCEGMLSFFCDSIIRPYEFESKTLQEMFNYYLEAHNSQVEYWKQVTVKKFDVEDIYGAKKWESTGYKNTKDVINELVEDYGGYLIFERDAEKKINYLSYVKQPDIPSSNQEIEFGDNLLNVTDAVNPENIYTCLIPIGYDSEGNKITIESVNHGQDYIESKIGVERYGKVFNEYTYDMDISSPQELLEKAKTTLEKQIEEARTITVKAFDKHLLDPEHIIPIDVYSILKVNSDPHNIHENQMCTKIKINMDDPADSEFTIGALPTSIADIIAKQQSK